MKPKSVQAWRERFVRTKGRRGLPAAPWMNPSRPQRSAVWQRTRARPLAGAEATVPHTTRNTATPPTTVKNLPRKAAVPALGGASIRHHVTALFPLAGSWNEEASYRQSIGRACVDVWELRGRDPRLSAAETGRVAPSVAPASGFATARRGSRTSRGGVRGAPPPPHP